MHQLQSCRLCCFSISVTPLSAQSQQSSKAPELWSFTEQIYKGCSESNASYFMMLAHNVRGGCWWYGSRGWNFPPISCYMLLPCDRWQQRGSLTIWRLIQKCIWSKSVSLDSSMPKKVAPTDIHWRLLNVYGDQTVDVSTVRQWVVRFNSGDTDMKHKPCSCWLCRYLQAWHEVSYSAVVKIHS